MVLLNTQKLCLIRDPLIFTADDLIFVKGHLVTTPVKLFSIQTICFWREDV